MTQFPSKEIIVTGCSNCPFLHPDLYCFHENRPVNPELALEDVIIYKSNWTIVDNISPEWCPLKEQKSIQITFKPTPEPESKEQGNWCHPNP